MGKNYKVVYDIKDCIGAAVCHYVDPSIWTIRKTDGKATLEKIKDLKKEIGQETGFFDEALLPKMMESAKGCPVRVIHIFDEDGKELL